MLREVLRRIVDENALVYRDISSSLEIPESLVRQMVWELQRLGYLSPAFQGCSDNGCSGCPMKCGTATSLNRAFVLTAKGERFLNRVREK